MLATDAFGGHGGIALYMRDVLRCLVVDPEAVMVQLIARHGRVEGVEVPVGISWDQSALRGKSAFSISVCKSVLQKEKPHLILCGHINLLPLARMAAMISRAPLVLFVYGVDAWTAPRNKLLRRLVSKVDLVLSISEITRQRFFSWSAVAPERIQLLPNAIKLERYSPGPKNSALLKRYGIEGKTVLMTLGRLSTVQRHKGVDEVIGVMPRLLQEFPRLVYLVAGDGDDISRLRSVAERQGVSNQVIFTGMIEESEKAEHYRLADAFALTGRGDGFGFVLLEAMACGVPAVASVLDGSQEAVLNGEIGTLVNPDAPESLISGLACALRQAKGIPKKLSYFSFDKFCGRLHAALQPLIKIRT